MMGRPAARGRRLRDLTFAFDRALAAGHKEAVAECAGQLLAGWQKEGRILHRVALTLARSGSTELARTVLHAACSTRFACARWQLDLAVLERRLGDTDAALAAATRALDADPLFVEALLERAAIHVERDEPAAAADAYDRALELGASSLSLHVNRSVIAFRVADMHVALAHAHAAVTHDPDSLAAQINAALIEGAVWGYETALARLNAINGPAANDAGVQRTRAVVLLKLDRHADALAAAQRAIAADPDHPRGHELLVASLRALQRYDEAFERLAAAAGFDAGGRLLVNRAIMQMEIGQAAAGSESLREALRRDPGLVMAWFCLADSGELDSAGDDVRAMEGLLERETISSDDRIMLHFALGKGYLARGDVIRAFEHFRAGNQRKRRQLSYDVARDERAMDDVAREFCAGALSQRFPFANLSERPVFVVGMPRSGTSLVEQLLASHPAVFGAGELPSLGEAAARRGGVTYSRWPDLAAGYLAAAGANAGDAARIVDKLPLNFLNLGFIRMLLPNARIIHCRRDPLDNGLSCYITLFEQGLEFTYDLVELGRFARAYARLMDHWRTVLPPDRFIEVDYEALVADVETQARRLIDFCGLEWNDAVLRFYETERIVRTASKLQVRKPIYRNSVRRAAAFGALLDPLRDALAGTTPRHEHERPPRL